MEQFKERIKAFWNLPISLKAFYYLLFLTFGDTVFSFVIPIINAAGFSDSHKQVFTILWVIGIYFSLSLFIKNIHLIDIVAYLSISAFYYLSPTIYPITQFYVESTFSSFTFNTIPFYFLALLVDFRRDSLALNNIMKIQVIMTAILVFFMLLGFTNNASTDSSEHMGLSYSILLPTMYLFYNASKNKTILDYSFSFLGISLILMLGTRGPLLCFLVFLFFFLFINNAHNAVMTINLIMFVVFFYIFLHPIIVVLMFITRMVGLSTRVFESFLDEEIINYESSSGRNVIHELLWSHISNDNGGIGYGFGSDRIMGLTGTMYAHNLIYEVWMNFGLYIGSFLLILFVIFIVKTFRKAYGSDQFFFLLSLFIWSVGRLMLSGSYLQDFQIYFFIGYCVKILRTDNDRFYENSDNDYIVISDKSSINNH